jgi:hypothetical protein
MSSINRGTLPTNFVDHVDEFNSVLRLPQPEPQYLFAQMAMAGVVDIGAQMAGMTASQLIGSMGKMSSPGLDRLVHVASTLPGAVTFIDAFGKGKGDTVKMPRDIYTAGTYTQSSRVLNTNASISTTGQVIHNEEVAVTLGEFIGPHNGSSVAPFAIWNFDAEYRAAKENLVSMVGRHLGRDYIKFLDTVIRDLFRSTSNITYADSVSNVLSFTAGAGHNASLEMVLNAKKALVDREWQPFANGRYALIVPTAFNTQMLGDADYRELSAFHAAERNPIFGYIGSVQDIDIYQCTTAKTYAATDTVPGDGNAVPAGATVYEALLFGPGAVGWGDALRGPKVRAADDTNYQTVTKLIWYAILAFQTLDNRGVQRILFQA